MAQPADRAAARGKRDGQPVEAVDAGDLLDQVGLALHVAVAPGGHSRAQAAVAGALDVEAEPVEDRLHAVARHGLAEQPLEALEAKLHRRARPAGRG